MKTKSLTVSFEPLDNAQLAHLCGALDENLRQIEMAYDVMVSRRGEHCRIDGDLAQARLAAAAFSISTQWQEVCHSLSKMSSWG